MANILLTGFEPFGKFRKNSSYEVIKGLDNQTVGKFKLIVKELPVKFKSAGRTLEKHIKEYKPKIVLSFGMGKETINFECLALNINYATRSDNDGVKVENEVPILAKGPIVYKTRLPFEKISKALKRRNIPMRKSFHAGTYLCNNVFYYLMHYSKKYRIPLSGFFHVPPTKECVAKNYKGTLIKASTLQKAIRLIVGEYAKAKLN